MYPLYMTCTICPTICTHVHIYTLLIYLLIHTCISIGLFYIHTPTLVLPTLRISVYGL